MSYFDENDDPVQYSLMGFQETSTGITRVVGPYVGIVMSVQPSDDPNSEWARYLNPDEEILEDDDNPKLSNKSSYLEATVLLIRGPSSTNIILPNCIIAQQKTSRRSALEEEYYADWSEDQPNGCTAEEVDRIYDATIERRIEDLSGDWVLVDFIGGILQQPIIRGWFPNPFNHSDASAKKDGTPWKIRRNGTQLQIDRNGDYTVTHRIGQFLQFKGETITIKHIKGQTIHLDEEGRVIVQHQNGHKVSMDDEGIACTTANNSFSLTAHGLHSQTDKRFAVVAQEKVDIVTPTAIFRSNDIQPPLAFITEDFIESLLSALDTPSLTSPPATALVAAASATTAVIDPGAQLALSNIVTILTALKTAVTTARGVQVTHTIKGT